MLKLFKFNFNPLLSNVFILNNKAILLNGFYLLTYVKENNANTGTFILYNAHNEYKVHRSVMKCLHAKLKLLPRGGIK